MIENLLPHLRYFHLTARYGSFTAAAQQLRISQSAVSLQISKLEEKLQCDLFIRESRQRVALSPIGKEWLAICEEVFGQLERALGKRGLLREQMNVRISGPSLFGSYYLLPFIQIFEKRHPEISVEVELTDQVADLSQGEIDIAIRWKGKKSLIPEDRHLAAVEFGMMTSQEYLRAAPPLKTPTDLKHHTLIVHGNKSALYKNWFLLVPKKERVKPAKFLVIDNSLAQLSAIDAGLGVSILPLTLLKHRLFCKHWRGVLPKYTGAIQLYGCMPRRHYIPKAHQIFLGEFAKWLALNSSS